MSRLDQLREKDKSLFIPFITAGDPTPDATVDLALMLQDLGADALELGIPFSDPLADGPVIQRASLRALKNGMTLEKAMELAKTLREKGLRIPVIIFTYYNLLIQLGEQRFTKLAKDYDIDGILVPDLPFEEGENLRTQLDAEQIACIQLVAPTTTDERLANIGKTAKGFLYCVSSLGVTGVRRDFHPEVFRFLERVRTASSIPIAVGFGVSSKQQIDSLGDYSDGVVVGSAIVREVENEADALASSETRTAAVGRVKAVLKNKFFDGDEVSGKHETAVKESNSL